MKGASGKLRCGFTTGVAAAAAAKAALQLVVAGDDPEITRHAEIGAEVSLKPPSGGNLSALACRLEKCLNDRKE